MRFNDTDLDTWADEFERTGATGAALFTDDDLDAWAGEHAVAEDKRMQPLRDAASEVPRVDGPGMVPQAIGKAVGNVAALGELVPKVDVQFGQDRPVAVSPRDGVRAPEWEQQATEISSMLGRGMAHTAEAAWQSGDFGSTQDELVESYRKVRDKVAADQEFLKTRQDWPEGLAQGLQSLPYSAVTMGASLLGHVAGVPLGKAGSVVGGGLASGATAYRASRHDFMGNVLMKATQELGRVPTPEEWGKLQKQFDEAASKYSKWEAIPEAVGNAVFMGVVGPGSKWAAGKLGEKFGAGMLGTVAKGPVGRVTTALVGTQAEEQLTEGITAWGQGGVEAEAGLRDTAPTLGEAYAESAPPTFWMTLITGGLGSGASMAAEGWKGLGKPKALPTDDVIDLLDVVQEPVQAPAAPPAQPAPPAAPSGGAGIGGRVNELAGQLQDLGSVPPADEEGVGMAPVAAAPLSVGQEVDLLDFSASAPGGILNSSIRAVELGLDPSGMDEAQISAAIAGEMARRNMMSRPPSDARSQSVPAPQVSSARVTAPTTQQPTVAPEEQSAPAPGTQDVIDLVDEVAAEIDDIEIQAQQAATSPMNDLPEPTPAQKEAGNYKKAHVRAQGFDIAIENPAGSERKGVDPDGKEWSVTMNNHYGYLKGTVGADKDHLDVFLGPDPRGGDIFVVDQVDPKTGEFDEHKVVMGAGSEEEARAIYLSNYEDGWQGLGAVTRMPLGTFRKWARSSKTKKAVGDISLTPTPVADQGSNNLIDNEGDAEALQRAEAEYGSSEKKQERGDEQRRSVEPGLEQYESGGVQQPAGGRTGERRVRGRRGTVHFPGGSEAFTYEVVDADELIPSHDPRAAFTPREDYGYTNERDYERNEYEQGKVVEHAIELEPDLLLSDSPTAEHGGPLVDRNNRVLGGNSRAMTLQVAYDQSMEGADRYRSSLARNAERFGLDKAEVEAMERPVLVRVMDRDVDGARAQSLVPAFNAGFTQAVDPEALGVSRGAKVSDETISVLAEGLEDGQTLREYLAGSQARRLVESLIEDGALDRTRLTVVMRGGEITPEGRDEIERTLRGRLVGDYGVIEGLQPSLLEALDASIPALVRLQGRGDGWDISKQFMAALRHVSRYRKNKSADGGSLDVYFRTPDMMGGIPGKKSRVVQILAHAIDNMGHAHLGKAMRDFTALAFAGQKSVAMLPGMGDLLPSRDQALEKFRTEKTPQALFEPALPAPPPAADDPAGQAPPPVMTERDEYAALFDEELAAVQSARLPKKESIAERQRRTRAVAKKVAKRPADVHAAQERAKVGAKKMAAGARAALDVFSKYGGLSVRVVKDGDAVNQGLYDELRPHLATVMQGAKEMGLAGRDLAREVVRFLIRTFGDQAAQARPYFMKFVDEEILNKERGDVDQQRGGENLERDSGPGESQDVVGAEGVQDGRGRADRTGGQGVRGAGGQGRRSGGDPGISRRPAPADGARGDSLVREETSGAEGRPSGSELGERSRPSGDRGLAPESVADVAIERSAERSAERRIKLSQAKAGEQKKGDLDNIAEQLPTLLPGQHLDVAFAEKRFENGAGVMFTNGTGTGKTGSGLGIVQRLVRAGKKNILIAVPADSIAKAWVSFAEKYLGLKVSQLRNTKDAGSGVVVTTHANMGMNKALATRNWDLIIMDEAHKSMSSEGAKLTRTLQSLRALALHRDGYYELAKMRYPEAYAAAMDKENQWRESDTQAKKDRALEIKRRWDDLVNEVKAEVMSAQARVKARLDGDGGRPGVVFLSATPFAYASNVDYAEGFLFDYPAVEGRGYNQPNGQQAFMIQHFGFRMRTGKLTKHEADVDSGYMERQFNSWLKREGVLSSRMLDVEHDYDRRFVLVDSAVGRTIDEGLQWLRENKRFYPLADLINERFDYHARQYLLEAIKANEAVPLIRQHLDLGRKVVVFHDFKQGGGFNPFDVSTLKGSEDEVSISTGNGKSYTVTIGELASEFAEKRPDLQKLPLASFQSPITTLSQAFPELLLFNGDVSPKNRAAAIESFQDDASGKNLILVQSAAGEAGISLHDTTGKHQRVLINLGMPTRPVTAIQQEGRIFRVGQQSNAMFRYLNTGTSWERWAFAGTIARRASTAENLSLGEEARALRDGFIQAFEESDAWAPGHEGEGTGGKDRDRAANQALTEWDRAKTMYFAQQRKNSRTKAAEGVDYFATPEPLGLKMVEWAGITAGMDVLEPSAGHGAIARWFPDLAGKTSVEPSRELASRLALVTDGRIVTGTFEGLHINNKYDAIVMNPPFGHGGKTAMEHVAKAFTHLREGGRIVAIVPEGPSMEKRFNAWYDSEDAKHAHLRMELSLPSAAFERAGTSVRAQVIVIDKAEKPVGDISRRSPSEVAGETVREFFDNLENRTAPERVQTEDGRVRQALEQADAERGVFFEAAETKHTKTGEDLFVAKKTGAVSYDAFRKIKGIAKARGGWWSNFNGKGAIPGFQFRERSKRDEFLELAAEVAQKETPGVRLSRRQKDVVRATGAKEAIDAVALAIEGQGKVAVIVAHGELGDITVDWGHPGTAAKGYRNGAGLSHIVARRGLEGSDPASALAGVVRAVAEGKVVREYGGANGRMDVAWGDYVAVLSKQRFGEAETWLLTGFMDASGAGGESYNPASYAPEGSVSRRQVGADYIEKLRAALDRVKPENQTVRRKGGAPAEGGLRASRVRSIVSSIAGSWARAPKVEVVQSVRDLPANLLHAVRKAGAEGDVQGIYHDGTIYLVADRMESAVHVHRTLLHESAGHHGLRLIMTDGELNLALDAAWGNRQVQEAVKEIAETYGLDLADADQRREAVEEVLANWAESGASERALDRFIAAVRRAIRRVLPYLRMSDAEIRDILVRARSAVEEGANAPAVAKEKLRTDAFKTSAIDADASAPSGAGSGVLKKVTSSITGVNQGQDEAGVPGTHNGKPRFAKAANKASPTIGVHNRPLAQSRAANPIIDYLRTKLQDKFLPLKRAQELLVSKGWAKTHEADAYRAEELFHGRAGRRLERFQEDRVAPLMAKIRESKVSLAELEDYLYAKYAPQRNAYIASINPDMPDAGSGRSDDWSKRTLAAFKQAGKTGALEDLAKDVRAITQMQRDIIRQEGLESDDTVDEWESGNPDYIPLKGGPHETKRTIGTGFNVKRSGMKRALGRTSAATDILANLFAQVGDTIIRAEKARVGRAFLKMAEQNQDADLWAIHAKLPMKRALVNGVVKKVVDHAFPLKDNVLAVTREDGSVRHIEIFDDDLARVMKNLSMVQPGPVVRALASFTRYLSLVNTGLNPEFVVTNFERDIMTASVHLAGEQSAQLARKVVKSVPSAMRGINNQLRGDKTHEWAKWFELYRTAGAQVSFMDLRGIDKLKRDIESMTQADPGVLAKSRSAVRKVFELIGDMNTAVENAVRLSAFRHAVESGMKIYDAASLAKNLTVNFNRKGELGPAMNTLYMFFNAGVQGSARVLFALRRRRVQMIVGGIVLLAWGLAELNRMVAGDDDDDENKWDKHASDWSKQTNLIMMLPSGDSLKIKLPYGYSWFVALGYSLSDVMHWAIGDGGKNPADAASFLVKAAMNSFNPLGGDDFLQMVSPTMMDPLVQIATNENFMGTKIMPDQNPYGAPRPNSQLYFRGVSKPARGAAEFINSLTGGDRWNPGLVDVSPEWIDHVTDYLSGGMGRSARDIAFLPTALIEGDMAVRRVPFLRQIYQERSDRVDLDRFYANLERIEISRAQFEEIPNADRRAFLEEHPEILLEKLANKMRTAISRLRKELYAAQDAGDKVRAKDIEKYMRNIALNFNKKYRKHSMSQGD